MLRLTIRYRPTHSIYYEEIKIDVELEMKDSEFLEDHCSNILRIKHKLKIECFYIYKQKIVK